MQRARKLDRLEDEQAHDALGPRRPGLKRRRDDDVVGTGHDAVPARRVEMMAPGDAGALREACHAVEALERTVGDLSKGVGGLATDVAKLHAEVAGARQPSQTEPPSVSTASPPPNPGAAPDLPSDVQPKPPEP